MDTKRAIESLKNIIEYWTYKPTEFEAVELAILALEKQTPKNVTGIKCKVKALDVETNHILTYECLPCPGCEKWLSQNNKYCPYCGQRLDWDVK